MEKNNEFNLNIEKRTEINLKINAEMTNDVKINPSIAGEGDTNLKENNTKERILTVALKQFAQKGYLATSMNDIANQINISKQAIYKHYRNKEELLHSIVERMDEINAKRVKQFQMPEGSMEEVAGLYNTIPVKKILEYAKAQFLYWAEDEFASSFRKMIMLEQYRSKKMGELFRKYLTEGPIEYMTELFGKMLEDEEEAKQYAYDFYGPIFIMYSLYDHTDCKEEALKNLEAHVEHFSNNFEKAKLQAKPVVLNNYNKIEAGGEQ